MQVAEFGFALPGRSLSRLTVLVGLLLCQHRLQQAVVERGEVALEALRVPLKVLELLRIVKRAPVEARFCFAKLSLLRSGGVFRCADDLSLSAAFQRGPLERLLGGG